VGKGTVFVPAAHGPHPEQRPSTPQGSNRGPHRKAEGTGRPGRWTRYNTQACRRRACPRQSKLEAQSSAQCGSAALSCGKPAAFRPVPQPSSSSAQVGRLSLPACAEEVLHDRRLTGRRSLPARQAAEPQVAADRIQDNLHNLGARPSRVERTTRGRQAVPLRHGSIISGTPRWLVWRGDLCGALHGRSAQRFLRRGDRTSCVHRAEGRRPHTLVAAPGRRK